MQCSIVAVLQNDSTQYAYLFNLNLISIFVLYNTMVLRLLLTVLLTFHSLSACGAFAHDLGKKTFHW